MPAPSIAQALDAGYRAGKISIAEVKVFVQTYGACFDVWPEPAMYDLNNCEEIARIKWQTMHEFDDLSTVLVIEPNYLRVMEPARESHFHSNEDPATVLHRVQLALEQIRMLKSR
jgi:hypothetical protein